MATGARQAGGRIAGPATGSGRSRARRRYPRKECPYARTTVGRGTRPGLLPLSEHHGRPTPTPRRASAVGSTLQQQGRQRTVRPHLGGLRRRGPFPLRAGPRRGGLDAGPGTDPRRGPAAVAAHRRGPPGQRAGRRPDGTAARAWRRAVAAGGRDRRYGDRKRHGPLPGRGAEHVPAERPGLAYRPVGHQGGDAAAHQHARRPTGRASAAVRGERAGGARARGDRRRTAPGPGPCRGPARVRDDSTRQRRRMDGQLGSEHGRVREGRAVERPDAAAGRAQRRGRAAGTGPAGEHIRGGTGHLRGGERGRTGRGRRRGGRRRPRTADVRRTARRTAPGRRRGIQRSAPSHRARGPQPADQPLPAGHGDSGADARPVPAGLVRERTGQRRPYGRPQPRGVPRHADRLAVPDRGGGGGRSGHGRGTRGLRHRRPGLDGGRQPALAGRPGPPLPCPARAPALRRAQQRHLREPGRHRPLSG